MTTLNVPTHLLFSVLTAVPAQPLTKAHLAQHDDLLVAFLLPVWLLLVPPHNAARGNFLTSYIIALSHLNTSPPPVTYAPKSEEFISMHCD